MVLPAAVVALTPLLLLTASMGSRSLLRLAEGSLKSSIHRVGWEQVFGRFSPEQRPAAKLMVDGAAARLAEGFGGGLLLAAGLWVVATGVMWARWSRLEGGDDSSLARVPDS